MFLSTLKTSVKWTSVMPLTLDKLTTTEQLAPKNNKLVNFGTYIAKLLPRFELSFCKE